MARGKSLEFSGLRRVRANSVIDILAGHSSKVVKKTTFCVQM